MVNRSLIRNLENDPDIAAMYDDLVGDIDLAELPAISGTDIGYEANKVVEGRILRIADGMVLVDIGFKAEGTVPLNEWGPEDTPPEVGQLVKVLVEDLEEEQQTGTEEELGMLRISKSKADKQIAWQE